MNTESHQNEIDECLSVVTRRYGNRLSEKELRKVRDDIANIVEAIESIRSVKLENGDEPSPIFLPYRRED